MGKGGNKFGKVDEFALDEFVLDEFPGKFNLEIGEFLLLILGNDIYDSMEEFDLAEVAEGLKEFELLLLELLKRDSSGTPKI